MNAKYSLILFFLGSSLIVGGSKFYEDKKSYKILRSESKSIIEPIDWETEFAEIIKEEPAPFKALPPTLEKILPPTLESPEEISDDHPPTPIHSEVNKHLTTLHKIKPSIVPDTYPHWNYYGAGSLKNHLHSKHGVAYELMSLFVSQKDLEKLHSYLHNGYDLLSL